MKNQNGLALPLVVVVSCLCSLWVLAQWRQLAMAQALGHSAARQWQLKQSALDTLRIAVDDIRLNSQDARHHMGTSADAHAFFPTTELEWQVLQSRLGVQECQTGICRPLGEDNTNLSPWLSRLAQSQNPISSSGQTAHYWVEVLPLASANAQSSPFIYRITALVYERQGATPSGWQALWQPPASTPFIGVSWRRLLPLSP